MSKAKTYFISSAYQTCNQVRCYMPQLYCGYKGSQSSLHAKMKTNEVAAKEINESDIVVFHRPDTINHQKAAIEMKRSGKIIIFDNDDTAYLDRGHPFDPLSDAEYIEKAPLYRNLIDNFIRNADAVTTTTEFLAQEYRQNNANVTVLPNCVDPDDWDEPLRNKDKKVRIIISGSAAYTLDFDHIKEYLIELDNREDVQLILFGLWKGKTRTDNPEVERRYKKEYAFWDALPNLEHAEWVNIENYPTALNNLKADIQIIPRYESYFNKAKSNLKFLEASMCELPCVVQSFSTGDSPYDHLPKDTCIKANSMLEWRQAVETLIKDSKLRGEMGKKAKEYVLENFNIQTRYKDWTSFYDVLFNKLKNNDGK